MALVMRARIRRVILNGSFVTDIIEPNDVDCLLVVDDGMPNDPRADTEIRDGLPYLDIQIGGQSDVEFFTREWYSFNRESAPKGMIEVIL